MGDIMLKVLAALCIAFAVMSAFSFGEWDKGAYFMANAAVLIGAIKL